MAFSDFLPEATHGTAAPASSASSSTELFDFEARPAAPGAPTTTSAPPPALPRAPDRTPLGARSPATGRRGIASLLFPGVILEPPEPLPPRAMEPVLSRALLVILITLLAANVWTLFVGWSAQKQFGDEPVAEVEPPGHTLAPITEANGEPAEALHEPEPEPEHAAPPHKVDPTPVIAARPEGYETLELSSKAIEQGHYERARRALFSLLSVADRLEPAAREDLMARASFMIGDAFHAEARAAAKEQP